MESFMSRAGLEKLKQTLEDLKKHKRQLSREVGAARELGDLKENAEYHAAKERLAQVVGKMMQVEDQIATARILDDLDLPTDAVCIGMKVVIHDTDLGMEDTYILVGGSEADPSVGKISIESPFAKGLIGHKVGETVHITLPKGSATVKILSIERAI
jgi:transcription elongation factor GreA